MTLNALFGWLNAQVSSGEEGPFELQLTLAEAAALAAEISSYIGADPSLVAPADGDQDRPTLEANAGEKSVVDALSESRDWLFGAGLSLSVMGRNLNSRELSVAGTNAEQAGLWIDRALSNGVGGGK